MFESVSSLFLQSIKVPELRQRHLARPEVPKGQGKIAVSPGFVQFQSMCREVAGGQ